MVADMHCLRGEVIALLWHLARKRVFCVNRIQGDLYDDCADGPSASPARKYVENGILVIERNGVKYNAQGGRL